MTYFFNTGDFGFTIASVLLTAILIIWTAVSTVVIIILAKAKVKIQNELKLANQTSTTAKETSSSCKKIPMELNENVAYAKYIHKLF